MYLKNRVLSAIGGSFEWFDFALYGFFSPIFAEIFFSHKTSSKPVALIIAYGVFAIGFAARPIGGLLFGYLGDKYGRIFALRITPLLSALTSVCMALLPTYAYAGNLAIVFLLITRILQGIFIGGEFTGNIVYLCESSENKKYFWGSIGSLTGSFGIFLASITTSFFYWFFSKSFMITYGWRIAFLIAVPLTIITFLIRLKITESPKFHQGFKHQNPMIVSYTQHKKRTLLCLGLILLHAISFYFVFMFIPIFLTKIRHLPESAAFTKNTTFLIFHLMFVPIFGWGLDKINGLKSTITIACFFVFLSIPLFYLICVGTAHTILISLFCFSIMTAFNAAVIPGLLSSLIPTRVRFTVLAFTYNVSFGIFAATVPFVCLLLIHKTGSIISPAFYMTLAALITLVAGYTVLKYDEIRKI